ncbi:hypothetical protein DPMN_078788 [Dreissena polymorpha]|uniref:Uncharacterized protein n=1 Tax=Dreissena polymorpha TaxID=45954 RepID=A0A9D4BQK4_DREPO|nr:hypothetical protein DPMN_078788 [Dreissena polymorpha]
MHDGSVFECLEKRIFLPHNKKHLLEPGSNCCPSLIVPPSGMATVYNGLPLDDRRKAFWLSSMLAWSSCLLWMGTWRDDLLPYD